MMPYYPAAGIQRQGTILSIEPMTFKCQRDTPAHTQEKKTRTRQKLQKSKNPESGGGEEVDLLRLTFDLGNTWQPRHHTRRN